LSERKVLWFLNVIILTVLLFIVNSVRAQVNITGSTWDAFQVTTANAPGFKNWGSGVITLTDTTTTSGNCSASQVTETSGYNPTTNFSKCFRVFFGCPGNDQIGTLDGGGCPSCPYTDFNGDGMAFSFWKNSATYNINAGTACGGGLGYDNALSDAKTITIEFDTYSSLGTSTVDGSYGGGPPGSGINDEISVHNNHESNDLGLVNMPGTGTVNAGNLEDGLEHEVCINYDATTHVLSVTIDGVSKLSTDLGASNNLNTYFAGATLNYTWSAGKYGANNMQTIAPSGTSIFGTAGHNFCSNVAPVSLISFTGHFVGDYIALNWATASELNNQKFMIERSSDMFNWTTIGEVRGAGTVSSIQNYSFDDFKPLSGIAYYRLRQVDFDGAFAYSNVVVIDQHKTSIDLFVVPNPFDDAFTIQSSSLEKNNVLMHDVLGRLVYQTSFENGSTTIRPELPSGTYILTVSSSTIVEQLKVIKK
jgi:hypothetical protein